MEDSGAEGTQTQSRADPAHTADAPTRSSSSTDEAHPQGASTSPSSGGAIKKRKLKSKSAQSRQDAVEAQDLLGFNKWLSKSVQLSSSEHAPASVRPEGLGRFQITPETHRALMALHDTILGMLRGRMVGWGYEVDHRERGYGFPPVEVTTVSSEQRLRDGGVQLRMREYRKGSKRAREDEAANWNACVQLSREHMPEEAVRAVREVISVVQGVIPERYRAYVRMDQLIALQPNCHRERTHLPLHCDQPLNDGFGVVIVTVAIRGESTILLVDEGDTGSDAEPLAWNFRHLSSQRGVYVLSGDARNKCLHGVLGDQPGRESLNLRFGLHVQDKAHPMSGFQEVDRHWQWGSGGEQTTVTKTSNGDSNASVNVGSND